MSGYKVDVKSLEKEKGLSESVERLRSFLEAKVGSSLTFNGGIIDMTGVEGLSKRTVKVWIKHFLRREGLKDRFKVSAEGDRLTIRRRS